MIWQTIKQDLSQPKLQDPAYRSKFELIFNYPGVWALVNYRFAHILWNKGFFRLSRIISGFSNFLTRVDIHPAAKIGKRVFIDHATGVVIGETAEIGDDCLIYQGVTLGGVSLEKGKRHPTLKNGVVVGAGAKILGNITIGENSKIGSNSVVVKSIPANCTAVGVPARILGTCEKDPFAHDKIPDISQELIKYLIKRIEILENTLCKENLEINKQDKALDEKYESYLNSLKN